MLAIGFKLSDTSTSSLRSALDEFLYREYASEKGANQKVTHKAALDEFAQLKTDVDLVRTPSATSRHVLLRYYAQLEKMSQRFTSDSGSSVNSSVRTPLQLQFTWNDSFCPRKKSTQTGLSFEKGAVMFNIGALESQLGVETDRSTVEGLKTACHHFMRAAGAFAEVKDTIVDRTVGVRTPDMSSEGLGMLMYLMLAQAQACFYEKAIKDRMKDAIKAKLVQQALDYYVSALEFCRSPTLVGAIDRSWSVHLQFQVHCLLAATQYWQGKASKTAALDRGRGYGEEITRLVVADAECSEACKLATQNKLPISLLGSAQALQCLVREHLEAARNDNASVYLENVPKFSELPVVGKAAMVKPVPFTTDEMQQELRGVDIFGHFIPKRLLLRADDAKREVKAILDQTAEKISTSNEAAKERLHSMELPASIEAFEKTSDNGIPRMIWQRIQNVQSSMASAGMRTSGSNENVVAAFIEQQLHENQSMSDKAEKMLRVIESSLSQEEVEDNMCLQNYGEKKWGRPPSSMLDQSFRADIDRYCRLITEAKASDGIVQEKLDENQETLRALSRSKVSLDRELPELQHDNSSCKEDIEQVSSLLLRLGQLVEEKDQVLHDFRGSFERFSALPALLSEDVLDDASVETALETEKQFFRDHFEQKVFAICEAEQTLLIDLVEANARFELKKEADYMLRERQKFLQRLNDAVDVFEQLESHVKEGATFYGELSARISQLHQTVADHCSARELEKRELEMNLTADEEMLQRESNDAALAQKMMEDMNIRNVANGPSANDEELARRLAGSTPQYYRPAQQGPVPPSYDWAILQSQQHQPYVHAPSQQSQDLPSYRTFSAASAPPSAREGSYSQPPQQRDAPQTSNFYQYPGQHQQPQYSPLFPPGPAGDSV
uniref:BRO1 domain-containing protein n=1 Tax=Hyaloperonospora arabidopsidis (strain Emoy2) TaxID=559515 RepID=M4BB69_HYAAE